MTETMGMLPLYRCHKEVWALKIGRIAPDNDSDKMVIHPENVQFSPFLVTSEWFQKHRPQEGGYWVQYKDGYTSYSPAASFEEGYSLIQPNTFIRGVP